MSATPLPRTLPRPTRADRDRAAARLREACAAERLSIDTFVRRLDLIFAARSRAELDAVVADIAEPGSLARALLAAIAAVSRLSAMVSAAWTEPRSHELHLPRDHRTRTIGRSRSCDFTVDTPSISRVHATLEWRDGGWLIADAASANGTWLNGWRVTDPVELRPGDELRLGAARFVVVP